MKTSRLMGFAIVLLALLVLSGCNVIGLLGPGDSDEGDLLSNEIGEDITSDRTLESGTTYAVTADVAVSDGATLTIEEGVTLEFSSNTSLKVKDDASAIEADGTSSNPIVMRGEQRQAGFWQGVGIYSKNARNTLNYVEIRHAGGEDWGITGADEAAALMIEEGKRVTLTNSTIADSADFGLYGNGNIDLSGFSSNTFTDNAGPPIEVSATAAGYIDGATTFSGNGSSYVGVYPRDIEGDMTLSALSGDSPYRFTDVVTVESPDGSTVTLTIEDGAVIEFASDAGITVSDNNSALVADGSSSGGVLFTGSEEQKGWWRSLLFKSNNDNNLLNNVTVEYAGGATSMVTGPDQKAAIALDDDSYLELTNSTIRHSEGYGVWQYNDTDVTLEASGNSYDGNESADTHVEN
ncbi:MAG: hypothetical protein ACOCYG_09135 [Spirochaetota bacterium]